jgi:hypothetical protein
MARITPTRAPEPETVGMLTIAAHPTIRVQRSHDHVIVNVGGSGVIWLSPGHMRSLIELLESAATGSPTAG